MKGLRLAEAALALEPVSRVALEAKLLALQKLQKGTRNGLEHAWLGFGIRGVQSALEARPQLRRLRNTAHHGLGVAMSQSQDGPRRGNWWESTAVGRFVVAVVVANLVLDIGLFALRWAVDPRLDPGDVWGTRSRINYQDWTARSEGFVLGLLYAQVVMMAVWTASVSR